VSINIDSVNWSFRKRLLRTTLAFPIPVALGWWGSYILDIPPNSEHQSLHIFGISALTIVWLALLLWRDYHTELNRALVMTTVQDELKSANLKQKILDKIPQSRNKELVRLLSPNDDIGAKRYIDGFFASPAGIEQILKGLVSYLSNLPEAKKQKINPSFRASLAPQIGSKQCELMYRAVSSSVNSPELQIKFTKNKGRTGTTLAGHCLETDRTVVISNVESYMAKTNEGKKNNTYGFQYLKEKDKILIKSIMCHPITDTDGKSGEEFCGILSIDTDIPDFFSAYSDELTEYYWVEAIKSFLVRIKFYTRLSNISKEIDYTDTA